MMFLLGGRCFALLAPRSLRPSGHLRCASSPPPGGLVVSAVNLREESDDTEVIPPWGARIMFRNYITSLQNTIGIF